VPVGAFLSGGVDSSLIVALMARETNHKVKTFSVGFEDQANAVDESEQAAETAHFIGTDHNRVIVGSNEIADHFGRFVTGLDQPSVDGFNTYFVSYAAAQGVTVALSGTGGDEIFLGYPWFAAIERQFGSKSLTTVSGAADDEVGARFRHAFGCTYHLFGPDAAQGLLAPGRRPEAPLRSFAEDLLPNDQLPDAGALDRASVLCLNGYTRNQLLRDIDTCSMAHSLEVRVPFLDPVVADFALSLPTASKLNANARSLEPHASYDVTGVKRIVCDVARDYLPPRFFEARSKTGFTLPFGDWLRGTLAETLADTLSPASVREAGLFDPDAVSEIYRGFLSGDRYWSHPWTLMVTELWRREVLAV
jgi:asparagine synthase (glutamine-hydrolysing)